MSRGRDLAAEEERRAMAQASERARALALVRSAARRVDRTIEERNDRIVAARALDVPLRDIAVAAGVAHPTVMTILKAREDR